MVHFSKIVAVIIVIALIIAGLYFFIGSQNKPATVSTVNWQQAQPLIHSGMPVKYQNVTVNGHSFTIAIQLMTPDGHIFSNSVIDEEVGVMVIASVVVVVYEEQQNKGPAQVSFYSPYMQNYVFYRFNL